jgi:hypothetical protein
LVETLIPKRVGKLNVLIDYGWTADRNISVLYKLSASALSSGVLSVPAALRSFIQGKFTLVTGDNFTVGTLVVKHDSMWGLGSLSTRRGGEPGDYLLLVFRLSERNAVGQLGDLSLADQVGASSSFEEPG